MSRCVATNAAAARCLFDADHGLDFHIYADDRDRYAHYYGRLASTVGMFIDGRLDKDRLARDFAEIEAMSLEGRKS